MNARTPIATRLALSVSIVAALALLAPAAASAHARVSPAVSVKGELQLYSLAVPTEKENATTSKVVMTVPSGFGIDSFVPPPPGWTQQVRQTGSGEEAVVTQVNAQKALPDCGCQADMAHISNVEAVDEHTVRFTLDQSVRVRS